MGRRRRQIKISTKGSKGVEEDLGLLGKTELIAGLTAFSSLESSLTERESGRVEGLQTRRNEYFF